MSTATATVKSIIGPVTVITAEGVERQLIEGDKIMPGDKVVTGAGGEVTLESNGAEFNLADGQQWPLADGWMAEASEEDEQLFQALADGADPTMDLEATAAGPGAGAGGAGAAGGGRNIVMLDETGMRLDPEIGYTTDGMQVETQGLDRDTDTLVQTAQEQPNFIPTLEISPENDGVVFESGLSFGSKPGQAPTTAKGKLNIDLGGDAMGSVTINGVDVTSGGTVTMDSGVLVVTPVQGGYEYEFTLTDSTQKGVNDVLTFDVVVTDAQGDQATGSFQIQVDDDAPVAEDDGATLTGHKTGDEGAPEIVEAKGNVLDNDGTSADGPVTVVGIQVGNNPDAQVSGSVGTPIQGDYGTIIIQPNGQYTYILDTDKTGSIEDGKTADDQFTYTITDADGDTSTAVITITINGTNSTPTLSISAEGDGTVFESGLAGGSKDGQTSTTATGKLNVDLSGDAMGSVTINGVDVTNGGTVNVDSGVLVVTPIEGGYEYEFTLTDTTQKGVDDVLTFDVVVTDAQGDFAEDSFQIKVDDDGPVAMDDSANVTEDGTPEQQVATGNVLDNDGESADGGVTVTGVKSGQAEGGAGVEVAGKYGTITINPDGSYEYTLDNESDDVQALGDGKTGTDSFTYTVTDADGSESSATINITVHGTNDAPEIQGPVSIVTDEDETFSGQIKATDADGDTLTFTVKPDAGPENGTVVFGENGTFTYTPNTDYSGSDSFTVIVDDGNGGVVEHEVAVGVKPVTDKPLLEVGIGNGVLHDDPVKVDSENLEGEGYTLSAWSRDNHETKWNLGKNPSESGKNVTQGDISLVDESRDGGIKGFGVAGKANSNNDSNASDEIDSHEMIRIDFDNPVFSFTAEIHWLSEYKLEGQTVYEEAAWTAYDKDGNVVAEGTLSADPSRYDGFSHTKPTIEGGNGHSEIHYIEFHAPQNSQSGFSKDYNDFVISNIEFDRGPARYEYDLTLKAATDDVDGSEQITSITVEVPEGSVLSHGTQIEGTNSWVLEVKGDNLGYTVKEWDGGVNGIEIEGVTIITPAPGNPSVEVTVEAQEGSWNADGEFEAKADPNYTTAGAEGEMPGKLGAEISIGSFKATGQINSEASANAHPSVTIRAEGANGEEAELVFVGNGNLAGSLGVDAGGEYAGAAAEIGTKLKVDGEPNNPEDYESEKLIFEFDSPMESVDLTWGWLQTNAGAKIEFYKDGEKVGEQTFNADGGEGINGKQLVEGYKPDSGESFDEIVISAFVTEAGIAQGLGSDGSRSDFVVSDIKFTQAPTGDLVAGLKPESVSFEIQADAALPSGEVAYAYVQFYEGGEKKGNPVKIELNADGFGSHEYAPSADAQGKEIKGELIAIRGGGAQWDVEGEAVLGVTELPTVDPVDPEWPDVGPEEPQVPSIDPDAPAINAELSIGSFQASGQINNEASANSYSSVKISAKSSNGEEDAEVRFHQSGDELNGSLGVISSDGKYTGADIEIGIKQIEGTDGTLAEHYESEQLIFEFDSLMGSLEITWGWWQQYAGAKIEFYKDGQLVGLGGEDGSLFERGPGSEPLFTNSYSPGYHNLEFGFDKAVISAIPTDLGLSEGYNGDVRSDFLVTDIKFTQSGNADDGDLLNGELEPESVFFEIRVNGPLPEGEAAYAYVQFYEGGEPVGGLVEVSLNFEGYGDYAYEPSPNAQGKEIKGGLVAIRTESGEWSVQSEAALGVMDPTGEGLPTLTSLSLDDSMDFSFAYAGGDTESSAAVKGLAAPAMTLMAEPDEGEILNAEEVVGGLNGEDDSSLNLEGMLKAALKASDADDQEAPAVAKDHAAESPADSIMAVDNGYNSQADMLGQLAQQAALVDC